jgi:phage baseplate assembly protein W
MNLVGSTLKSPFRADQRGTLETVSDPDVLTEQAIITVLRTRQGERVMMPDFGLPDLVFAVAGPAFAARLAFHIEEQVRAYVPGVEILETTTSIGADGEINTHIQWQRAGAREPRSLVYPIWRLRNAAR